MNPERVAIEADEVTFESEPSTVLEEAIQEFEKSRQELYQDEASNSEEAWSILANQIVGHENL